MIDGQTDQQKCLVNSELVIEKAIVDYFFLILLQHLPFYSTFRVIFMLIKR